MDLAEAFEYIRKDSPRDAEAWLARIEDSLHRLSRFPRSGSAPKDPRLAAKGYRMVVVGEYLAFYVVRQGTLQVRRLIHGKRRYSFLL